MQAVLALVVIVLAAALPGRALAFIPCTAENYLSYFDPALAPQPCADVATVMIDGPRHRTTLRVIRLATSSHGDDSLWRAQAEHLAAAVGPALRAVGTAYLPREISLLVTDRTESTPAGGPVHAEVTAILGTECIMSFYKLARDVPVEEFTFTLAHEIFHCAQIEAWEAATEPDAAGWWMEGSAEYFAHLAQPGTAYGDGYIDAFDANSLRMSLVEMEYENVVFFLGLATSGGPSAVGSFIAAMPVVEGRAAQLARLREALPMADWTSFIETWLDGRVTRPGGGSVSPGPYAHGQMLFSTDGELELASAAYRIDRWGVAFAEDKSFDLEVTVGEGTPRSRMKIFGSGDAWTDPPETVNTCDGEKSYILYFTTTEGPGNATLAVDHDETLGAGACCLVGAWAPTAETLNAEVELMMQISGPAMAAAGANFSCAYDGGGWLIHFLDDGSGRIDYDAHTNTCTTRAAHGAMSQTMARSGTTGFEWNSESEGFGMASYAENSVTWTHTMKIGPMVQSRTAPDGGPPMATNSFAYTCAEDRLSIYGLYGLNHMEMTYTRVEE